jgi:hypothetical protein
MEVSGQLHAPDALPPGERTPGSHWTGGWVGSRAVLYAVVKKKIPSPHRESNPRTPIVHPVAQRYTDYHKQYKLWSSSLCNLLHSPVTSSFLDPNILVDTTT